MRKKKEGERKRGKKKVNDKNGIGIDLFTKLLHYISDNHIHDSVFEFFLRLLCMAQKQGVRCSLLETLHAFLLSLPLRNCL